MSSLALCSTNYGPRRRHITGRIVDPYAVTVQGLIYADGRRFLGTSQNTSVQPMPKALVVGIPNCRTCHAGC